MWTNLESEKFKKINNEKELIFLLTLKITWDGGKPDIRNAENNNGSSIFIICSM